VENTIVISSLDLVEHVSLARKRNEAKFRVDFLIRKGASENDEHVSALKKQIENIESKFRPIDERMSKVDIISIVPNREEIDALTNEISQHTAHELDEALKTKKGDVYELLKKRAQYTKSNYDNKEQIARFTILMNSLPRKEAEILKTIVESNTTDFVDVSCFDDKKQKDLTDTMNRLGIFATINNGKLMPKREEQKIENEIQKEFVDVGGLMKTAWVQKDNEAQWDENEKKIAYTSKQIQIYMAKIHAQELTEEQRAEFELMQKEYIELKQKRNEIGDVNNSVWVSLPIKK
jgi:hypothetical protein